MAIETLQDYNTQASCCCPQILCPIIEQVCESITIVACGEYLPVHPDVTEEEACMRFATLTFDSVDNFTENGPLGDGTIQDLTDNTTRQCVRKYEMIDGICTQVVESTFFDFDKSVHQYYEGGADLVNYHTTAHLESGPAGAACSGFFRNVDTIDPANDYDITVTTGCTCHDFVLDATFARTGYEFKQDSAPGDPARTLYSMATYSDLIDPAWFAARFAEKTFPDDATGNECVAELVDDPNCEGQYLSATAVRYRWRIPSTWTDPVTGASVTFPGTYFKIVWDVINEPYDWDAMVDDPDYTGDPPIPQVPKPERGTRSWYSEDNEAIWTGPGSGDQDDDSWFTGYSYINAPTTFVGSRRVVNVRFVCREDWGLGVLPQVTGEAVTLPDP